MQARRHAPATERNREPLLAVLERVFAPAAVARVLEVASGTGQHAAFFAARLPHLTIQPTDFDPANLASIDAWCAGATNVLPALRLDAAQVPWQATDATGAPRALGPADAILCVNMIHIAPWSACLGLLGNAATTLAAGAPLVFYGPYRRAGVPTAPSNEAFDASLRAQNAAWGLRNLEDVVDAARDVGLRHEETVEMPANNLVVVFRRDVATRAVL
jgi:SAM-dependent methyltransferase